MISTTFKLALKSMRVRKATLTFAVLSVAASIILILGVSRFQQAARDNFFNTVSETDVLVGSRTSPLGLLLSTLFQIGAPPANIKYSTFQEINSRPEVSWAVPLSFGDSHKGFRVLATNESFFEHYKFGRHQSLAMASGKAEINERGAVVGAFAAEALGYKPGDKIVVTHGLEESGLFHHDDMPFIVSGIMEPTGTVLDQTIIVSLQGFEDIHEGWKDGAPAFDTSEFDDEATEVGGSQKTSNSIGEHKDEHAGEHKDEHAGEHQDEHAGEHKDEHAGEHKDEHAGEHKDEHAGEHKDEHAGEQADEHMDEHAHHSEVKEISAALVGLKQKTGLFQFIGFINSFEKEPLLGVVPDAALLQLWEIVGVAEKAFLAVSIAVFAAGLLGIISTVLSSLSGRRREIAILRSVGASPSQVFILLSLESILIVAMATGFAIAVVNLSQGLLNSFFFEHIGFDIPLALPSAREWLIMLLLMGLSVIFSLLPAYKAYKLSISSGLHERQ